MSRYCCSFFLFHLGSVSTANLIRTSRALKHSYKLYRTAFGVNNTECFCSGPHLDLHQQASAQCSLKTLSCSPRAPRHLPAPFLSAWWACCCASTAFSMPASLFLHTRPRSFSNATPEWTEPPICPTPTHSADLGWCFPPTEGELWHRRTPESQSHRIIQVGKDL